MIHRNNNNDIAHRHQSNFYIGVIEDRLDPEKLGRVRVRVFGLHTDDRVDLPTAGLPWAAVLMPNTGPSMNGMGANPFLLEGSWVIVVFFDAEMQEPLVMGSLAGISSERRSADMGFTDPRGHYPRESHIGRPDINARARGETDRRMHKNPGNLEPDDPYDARYPYNHVFESESGHIMEMDDTPGGERINLQHRLGTFIEMNPDGSARFRSGDRYDSCHRLVLNIDGNADVNISGDANMNVQGRTTMESAGDITARTEGDLTAEVIGDTSIQGQGSVHVQSERDIDLTANRNINMNAGDRATITAGGRMTLIGRPIHENPPAASPAVPANDISMDLGELDLEIGAWQPRYRAPELSELVLPDQPQPAAPEPDDDAASVLPDSPSELADTEKPLADHAGYGVYYTNALAQRNLPVDPALERILLQAAMRTGTFIEIFSGGQAAGVSRGVVGSHRHDDGQAADIYVFTDRERTRIIGTDTESDRLNKVLTELRNAGAVSIGAGPGYMGGRGIHVDLDGSGARYWGYSGRTANAPDYLRRLFA